MDKDYQYSKLAENQQSSNTAALNDIKYRAQKHIISRN